MNEKEKLSLKVRYQVINVGGMMELDKIFVFIMEIIFSAVNHHWILKICG